MIASQVHSVIAAGLEDPELLARWKRDPASLRECGVDPDAFDVDALWKFAGLSTKVRHNGLRADYPLTFRLLNVAGLEIEVFASYASFRAAEGKTYASTSEARAQDLLEFLERWLDFDKHEHALLWELFRHEMALARLGKITPRSQTFPAHKSIRQRLPGTISVPSICGEIVLQEMRCDPRVVGKLLRQKSPPLEKAPLSTTYFCYWRASAANEISILELDVLGFYLLSLIDGNRSTADLSFLISGSRRRKRGLVESLAQLAALGIVSFE